MPQFSASYLEKTRYRSSSAQHHPVSASNMGLFFSTRDRETAEGWGKVEWRIFKLKKKQQKKLIRCTKELSWLSRRFTLQEDNDDKHTAQITCPWVAQLENWPQPNQTLSRETWKRVIYWEPPSNLTGLESICREEQQNIVKSKCANFMTSYSRRLEAIW